MKKGNSRKGAIFITLFLILLSNIFAVPVIAAKDVAYVFKSRGAIDKNIVEIFEDMGLEVDLINERDIDESVDDGVNLEEYRIVFFGDERYRNVDEFKPWKRSSIISNYFFGELFGITDRDGVSKLASNAPLNVMQDNEIIQVYTKARFDRGSISISYYYLANENKAPDLDQAASTFTGDSIELGDVISYGDEGTRLLNGEIAEDNICFFGIIESKFWTPEAEELFEECVEFVGTVCSKDSECPDMDLGDPYCDENNIKNVVQDVQEFECQNPGTVKSECVDDVVPTLVEVCTSTCSEGKCICLDNDGDSYDDCNPGDSGDDGKKIDCNDNNFNVNPGALEICDGIDNDCDGQIDEGGDLCQEGNICHEGGCREIECSSKNDCGKDGVVGDLFCNGPGNDDVFQDFKTFTCSNPGTIDSSCSDVTKSRLVTQCQDTCFEGSCVEITCRTDSDCDDSDDFTKDICKNPGKFNSECTYKPIECLVDLDCDDNNDHTQDTCENPGKVNSECTYRDIICLTDSECGLDGPVGKLFCDGKGNDDVFQNFITHTCDNPGKISSDCSEKIEPILKEMCQDTCREGSCVEIMCYNDLDCDDKDPNTLDICIRPGTPESKCTNEGITCKVDKDCGTDRHVGDLFCQGKDLYRDFLTNKCNVPGSVNSFCTEPTEPDFIFSCTYACSDGNCIRCNDNNDCDDGKENTVDICRYPSTMDSFCSHDPISCFEDSDCGTDGLTGALFCKDDNVHQKFMTFTCKDRGTSQSSCDDDSEDREIKKCDFGCSKGECKPEPALKECQNTKDDDRDGLIDAQDPGCWDELGEPNTYNPFLDDESRGTIICSSEVECGIDGFIGNEFCDENDVQREYKDFTCNYPGTGLSFCSNKTTKRVTTSCTASQVCDNAQCVQVVCFLDSDCDDNDDHTLDICKNPGKVDSKCTNEPIRCLTNDECGTDGFIGELTCQEDDVYQDFIKFTCDNPGKVSSECSDATTQKRVLICQDTCSGGACVDVECNNDLECDDNDDHTLDTCNNPGEVDSECTYKPIECLTDLECDDKNDHTQDTCDNPGKVNSECTYKPIECLTNAECGTDGLIGELFCQEDDVYQDLIKFTCNNPGKVSSECSDTTTKERVLICQDTCSGGACVEVACNNDLDCDDNDDHTLDICKNPGKVNSGCTNEPIECLTNAECGKDGFVDNLFCQEDDVYRNFQSFTCDNPGTTDSSCADIITPALISICQDTCSEGACVEIECHKNSDCDDNDSTTEDICLNPGTVDSQCTNEKISCSTNSDCGVDTYTQPPYCQENDGYQLFITHTCNNPNTASSECSSKTEPRFLNDCNDETETCNAGACIPKLCKYVETFDDPSALQNFNQLSHGNGFCSTSISGGKLRVSCPNNVGKSFLVKGFEANADSVIHSEVDISNSNWKDGVPTFGFIFADGRWGNGYWLSAPMSLNPKNLYSKIARVQGDIVLANGGGQIYEGFSHHYVTDINSNLLVFTVDGLSISTPDTTYRDGLPFGIWCNEAYCVFDNFVFETDLDNCPFDLV